MNFVTVNGIKIAYDDQGTGPAVLLVAPAGADRRVWRAYQVPALLDAGYRVITFNNRGIPPSAKPDRNITLADLVADTGSLIEALDLAPCRVIGVSMGAFIGQELAAARPELMAAAILMGTKARQDSFRQALDQAQRQLAAAHDELPSEVRAVLTALQYLSPRTLRDEVAIPAWLKMFEQQAPSTSAHMGIDYSAGKSPSLASVSCPCLVIGFRDDILAPPHLCREVADAIPAARFVEVPACGHLGYLEQPDVVNELIVEFLGSAGAGAVTGVDWRDPSRIAPP